MKIRSVEDLQEYVNGGNKAKYVFFWGHQNKGSEVSKSCFSQWYESDFTDSGVRYMTAEHFMMAEKAKLFKDLVTYEKIINASNPGEAKSLGREVIGFDESLWLSNRFDIVVRGNLLKFGQNPELKEYLLNTGDRILVEASPVDKIWGVGLATDNRDIENPNLWRGLNLLGFALMEVRYVLSQSGAYNLVQWNQLRSANFMVSLRSFTIKFTPLHWSTDQGVKCAGSPCEIKKI